MSSVGSECNTPPRNHYPTDATPPTFSSSEARKTGTAASTLPSKGLRSNCLRKRFAALP